MAPAPLASPATLCRMGGVTIAQIRTHHDVRPLLRGAVLTIAIGAAAYGATMGWWRGPRQALYAAIKLSGLLLTLFALTALSNAMFAGLLRARLSGRQVSMCALSGLAVTAAILGAMAPLSAWVTAHAPTIHPGPQGRATAEALLAGHIVVFAFAGVAGIATMHRLMRALVGDSAKVRRLMLAWLIVEGLVGAQLSWLARPFVGKPDLPITFLRHDAFANSLLDELLRIGARLGTGAWINGALLLVGVGLTVAVLAAHAPAAAGRIAMSVEGLWIAAATEGDGSGDGSGDEDGHAEPSRRVPWSQVRGVSRRDRVVEVLRQAPGLLAPEVLAVTYPDAAQAGAAVEALAQARSRHGGPYRHGVAPGTSAPPALTSGAPPDGQTTVPAPAAGPRRR